MPDAARKWLDRNPFWDGVDIESEHNPAAHIRRLLEQNERLRSSVDYWRHGNLALRDEKKQLEVENERLRYDSRHFNEQWCFANADIAGLKVRLKQLEARVQRLTEAIQKELDDEESGEGWGPDVTTVAYLREAIDAVDG